MYELRLFNDVFEADAVASSVRPAPHTINYVFQGSAEVDGQGLDEGSAAYGADSVSVRAGAGGATLWRWELVRSDEPLGVVRAEGVESVLRMARKVKMFELVPTSKWLFRLDKIIGFEGTTGLHSHPGSGIRSLLSGHLRAESDKGEESDNRNPGDVWYEEGAYPLVSTVDPGIKTTFLRGMVLPPEYVGHQDSANWIGERAEGEGPKLEGWQGLVLQVVTLL
jgi:hypothetical protein